MRSVFSEKIEKRCETCVFCAFEPEADRLLCEKKGLVKRDSRCFRYKYDPFKRVPRITPTVKKPDASEFSLDVDDKEEGC